MTNPSKLKKENSSQKRLNLLLGLQVLREGIVSTINRYNNIES